MLNSSWVQSLSCVGIHSWRPSANSSRRRASEQHTLAEVRIERLEERAMLSGFGSEDGAYIVEARSGTYTDIKIQPADQKIVAAGNVQSTNGVAIARYDALGNGDANYGTNGLSTPSGGGNAGYVGLALQPDGRAIVSTQNGIGWYGAARFNTNGSLDTNFGSGGWSGVNVSGGGIPRAVGLQSTGKIVVGGETIDTSQGIWFRSATVARFKANGATDSGKGGFGQVVQGGKALGYTKTNFGAQLAEFKAIAVQSDDKIVAVGDYSPTGSPDDQLIVARYTSAGILDTTFNGTGYSVLNLPGISYTNTTYTGNGVALQSDGKIVIVSTAAGTDGSDLLVVRYNTNGTLDTTFGAGIGYVQLDLNGNTYESGADVAIQPDGKIVAIGQEFLSGVTEEQPRNVLVARLNADGSPDSSFGSGGFKIGAPPIGTQFHSFVAKGGALQSDGSIIVAGVDYQSSELTNPHPLLMRFFSGATPGALQAEAGASLAPSDTERLNSSQVQPLLTAPAASRQATGAAVSGPAGLDSTQTQINPVGVPKPPSANVGSSGDQFLDFGGTVPWRKPNLNSLDVVFADHNSWPFV